jgi:hypothetical protein
MSVLEPHHTLDVTAIVTELDTLDTQLTAATTIKDLKTVLEQLMSAVRGLTTVVRDGQEKVVDLDDKVKAIRTGAAATGAAAPHPSFTESFMAGTKAKLASFPAADPATAPAEKKDLLKFTGKTLELTARPGGGKAILTEHARAWLRAMYDFANRNPVDASHAEKGCGMLPFRVMEAMSDEARDRLHTFAVAVDEKGVRGKAPVTQRDWVNVVERYMSESGITLDAALSGVPAYSVAADAAQLSVKMIAGAVGAVFVDLRDVLWTVPAIELAVPTARPAIIKAVKARLPEVVVQYANSHLSKKGYNMGEDDPAVTLTMLSEACEMAVVEIMNAGPMEARAALDPRNKAAAARQSTQGSKYDAGRRGGRVDTAGTDRARGAKPGAGDGATVAAAAAGDGSRPAPAPAVGAETKCPNCKTSHKGTACTITCQFEKRPGGCKPKPGTPCNYVHERDAKTEMKDATKKWLEARSRSQAK